MDAKINEMYELWLARANEDPDLKAELQAIAGDEAASDAGRDMGN